MSNSKLIIMGIDGGTWNLISPWAREGKLPHFRRLVEKGVSGPLESTDPPRTSPAWPCFMTGKSPGKLGVFGFINFNKRTKETSVLNYSDIGDVKLWDVLSSYGFRVGVVGVPMTYPPDRINGFMVSGFGTPTASRDFTYPASLKKEIAHTGFNPAESGWSEKAKDEKLLTSKLLEGIENNFKAVEYLMEEKDWDVFIFVVKLTDEAGHFLWHKPDQMFEVYKKVDEHLGRILKGHSDKNFMVMSDHGMGESKPPKKEFNINKFLEKQGLLHLRKQKLSNSILLNLGVNRENVKKILAKTGLYDKILKLIPEDQKRKFPTEKGGDVGSLTQEAIVNWEHTKAIFIEGRLYILEEEGTEEYERVRDKIKERVSEEGSRQGVEFNIYNGDEVYPGSHKNKAPDLKIYPGGAGIKSSFRADKVFEPSHPDSKGGAHKKEGILIGWGPDVKEAQRIKANIFDITPTALYMMGVPVPKDMDGRVLKEILKKEPVYVDSKKKREFLDKNTEKETLPKEDEEKVKERLRELGYLD